MRAVVIAAVLWCAALAVLLRCVGRAKRCFYCDQVVVDPDGRLLPGVLEDLVDRDHPSAGSYAYHIVCARDSEHWLRSLKEKP